MKRALEGRRKRGLEPAGTLGIDELGLASRQARDSQVEWAWRATCGEVIARRTKLGGLRRGVLHIELEDGEGSWVETLTELLPGLAARMARDHPRLGIRRYRISGGPIGGGKRSMPLPAESAWAAWPKRAEPREQRGATRDVDDGDPSVRLRRVMERYLQRAAGRTPRGPRG